MKNIQPNRPKKATEIDYRMENSVMGQPPKMQKRKEPLDVIYDGMRKRIEIMQRISRT